MSAQIKKVKIGSLKKGDFFKFLTGKVLYKVTSPFGAIPNIIYVDRKGTKYSKFEYDLPEGGDTKVNKWVF